MTAIWYDTEFLENGTTIELISIGMVAEDGSEYYAVNADLPADAICKHKWLVENVWPHLPLRGFKRTLQYTGQGASKHEMRVESAGVLDTTSTLVRPRWVIRNEVREFLAGFTDLELWADYGAYDHVALCQLFGTMMDLPSGVPMWTNDIRHEWARLGQPELPEQAEAEHDALADARHCRALYEALKAYDATR